MQVSAPQKLRQPPFAYDPHFQQHSQIRIQPSFKLSASRQNQTQRLAAGQEQMLQYQLHLEIRKNKLAKLHAKLAQQERLKAAKKTLRVNPEEWNGVTQTLTLKP